MTSDRSKVLSSFKSLFRRHSDFNGCHPAYDCYFRKLCCYGPFIRFKCFPNEQGQPSRQHLVASFFDVIRSRLELFLTEAEEQKWRLVEIFIWLLFMAVVSLLLLMVLVALSVLVLPPGWRIVGLCFWVIVGFGTIGLGVYRVKKYAQQSSPMFAETMNQLKKDQACFSDPT